MTKKIEFIDYSHLSDYGNSFITKAIIDIVKNKNF